LIFVDKMRFIESDFAQRFREISNMEHARSPENKLYAVCVKHPFDVLSILFYVRDRQGSVLLLHADTPLQTAIRLAEDAGCFALFYERWDSVVAIKGHAEIRTPSLYQFSSGTTGAPKLIGRSWPDIESEIEHYNLRFGAPAEETPVILVPVSHSFGLIAGSMTAMARGAEPVIVQDRNPKFALHLAQSLHKPIFYAVPFLYHLMDQMDRTGIAIHKLVSSGAPLSETLLERLSKRCGSIWQQYGCTEAGCVSLGEHPSAPTDVGEPLAHRKVFLDAVRDHDAILPELYEVVVNCGDRQIATRDIGTIVDGRLHVHGRVDELINVSGLKVMPAEVESVIARLPGVRETVVFKATHPVWGEAVKAMIVASDDSITETAVKGWCMQHLPQYKVPGFIEIVNEIPRLPSGKISRKLLQEMGK